MPIIDPEKEFHITWPKPNPPPKGATIGEKVEYSLGEGVRRFLSLFDEPLSELIAWSFRLILKVVEKSAASILSPVLDHVLESMPDDNPIRPVIEELKAAKGEGAAGILLGLGSSLGGAGLMSIFEPWFEYARQGAYRGHPYKTLDLISWIASGWRGQTSRPELVDQSLRLGYREDWLDRVIEIVRPRLDPGSMGTWYLRDRTRLDELKGELEKKGYVTEDVDRFVELLDIIPGPQDIITMAVREAWDDEFATAWGSDLDYNPVVGEWAEKVGLSKDWMLKYWRAHWQLPSVQLGYEMLHRGVIIEDQLKALMKALDIMPGWRQPLIDISYAPYTRVDVRRMFNVGTLTIDEVKDAYKALGYDEEKAKNLTSFTMALYADEDRDATKADIIASFGEGIISEDEAYGYLIELGYLDIFAKAYIAKEVHRIEKAARVEEDADTKEEVKKEREITKAELLSAYEDKMMSMEETLSSLVDLGYVKGLAEFLISRVDFKVAQNLLKEAITTTKTLYVNGEIDTSVVHSRLGQYALPGTQIQEYLKLWDIERERKTERPSIAKLIEFYQNHIFEVETLTEELTKQGLNPRYTEWYVADINYTILKKEQAELARQQAEQDRLSKTKLKTARDTVMADLNVKIQEWLVFIADLNVAAFYATTPEEKSAIKEQAVSVKLEIAKLQLEKAKIPIV